MLKISTIILALVLILGLGACQAPPPSDIIKLTIWHGINPPSNRDIFQKLVDRFNQSHPKIQIESLYVGQSDQQLPKILSAVLGNVPPDILWFVSTYTGQFVQLGALLPLEDWFNKSSIKAEIEPSLYSTMILDNHIWSIPFATNNTAVFYRPSLFQKAQITTIPQTWNEFRQTAQKLTLDTNQDNVIDQWGVFLSLGQGEWTVFSWLPFVYSAGGRISQGNKPDLVNRGAIAALLFATDLLKDGSAILSAPERGYEQDNFIMGRAAMQITGPWTLGQLKTTKIDYDVFPIPKLTEKAAVTGGENLFVFKSNPQREQAVLVFLEYVLSEEFQTEWALGTGYLPINIKSINSAKYQAFVKENPVLKVFLDQMKYAKSRPLIPNYNRLSLQFGRAIESVLLQKASPEKALADSQQRAELLMSN